MLIAGGFNNNDSFLKSTSIYDGSSLWPSSGSMTAARWALRHALPNGLVLAIGGEPIPYGHTGQRRAL